MINPVFGVKMRSQLAIHDSRVILSVCGDSICVRLRLYTCSVGFEQVIDPLTNQSRVMYLKILINRDFGSSTLKPLSCNTVTRCYRVSKAFGHGWQKVGVTYNLVFVGLNQLISS